MEALTRRTSAVYSDLFGNILRASHEQNLNNTGILAVPESPKKVVAYTDPCFFVAAGSSPDFR
jgi:hypothetical protein